MHNYMYIQIITFVVPDIDECAMDTDMCHQQAFCVNTDGSYTCTCNSGYNGSGLECIGNMQKNTLMDKSLCVC